MYTLGERGGARQQWLRVLEIDPVTLAVAWLYAAPNFFSTNISGAQRLANGNTLITEGAPGRVFEVTAEREIVWEYINPVRGGAADQFIPVVAWGQRIDPAKLDPAFLESPTS